MEETDEDKGKRLRMQVAILEDEVDSDWSYMADRLSELEAKVERMPNGIVAEACGLVIVQCYLNGMRRKWQELDDELPGSSKDIE